MTKINTVLGPISSDKLGTTLIHEHLLWGYPAWFNDTVAPPFNRQEAVEICLKDLKQAKLCGVKTIVDASPADCGLDINFSKEVAEKSGVNVIAVTGMYTEEEGAPSYWKFRDMAGGNTQDELYELFMKDITQGIQRTDIKAGVIKVATGYGKISPFEENVLKAAARAQKETGIPIITHTEKGTMGPEQADLLISEGADPKRVMIGHIGNADLKYQASILEKGVYIAFDRMGIEPVFPDVLSVASIVAMVSMGYANRLLMSHDHVSVQLGKSPPRAIMEQVMPKWHLGHIFDDIVSDLEKAGITDKQVHMIMKDNPQRLFSGE